VVSVYDAAQLEGWFRAQRRDPYEARRVRHAFLKRGASPAEALATLPRDVSSVADGAIRFHPLTLLERVDAGDGATKLLFETASGARVESVILRIASGRTTLCVSSQAGCAARCSFCATGAGGLQANLSADEILDQLGQANRELLPEGRRVRNVVFMGMGEPLHNLPAVERALEELTSPAGYDLPAQRVLVSTVGIPEGLLHLARRFPRLGLALSLHSARPAARQRLIPLAAKHSLSALREAIEEVSAINPRGVMLEVLLLADETDTPADLEALLEFSDGLDAHLNLIPFNPVPHAPQLHPSSPERIAEFAAALRAAGRTVTIRRSLGGTVAGACGQLASYAEGSNA